MTTYVMPVARGMDCGCTGSANDVGAFLSVFAALLLDNVLRFEETASRVTKIS